MHLTVRGVERAARWLAGALALVVLASGCTSALPPGVQWSRTIPVDGEPYRAVKGLLPGRYGAPREALRAACDKYLNLPGAFDPFNRSVDPKSFWDYWSRTSVEYCGFVLKTEANEYGNSTITMDKIQGIGKKKKCTYPDSVLLENDSSHSYSAKDTLTHNHSGGTKLSSDDCEALKNVLAFQAAWLSFPADFSMTMAAFIGRQGQTRVDCDGWYELTIQYSEIGYQGQEATERYYDANLGRYDATRSMVLDLDSCEVKK